MKLGEIASITKRDATIGILVCIVYSIILLGGLYLLGGVF
jgi:hypothetical protein